MKSGTRLSWGGVREGLPRAWDRTVQRKGLQAITVIVIEPICISECLAQGPAHHTRPGFTTAAVTTMTADHC